MQAIEQIDNGCRYPVLFRGVLTAAQAATVILSWNLWEARDHPPLVPLLPVPQIDLAGLMLAAIGVSCLAPRHGLPVQAALLLWSVVSDQCRMQPTMLSMLILACGTIPGCRGGVLLARASLISLWCFSGIHKLLSPGFYTGTMPWLLGALGLPRDGVWPLLCGAGLGGIEVLLGIGCLVPSLRSAVAIGAFIFHASIFVTFSPLGIDWNPEVVPWNAALACAGLALIAPWPDRVFGAVWHHSSRIARFAAAVLLICPLGYWLGVVDAYLAHCLYSDDTPRAFICTPFDRRDLQAVCLDLGIMVPPAHRLFEPVFLGVGRPGEWLEVEDPRWIARWRGLAPRTVRWYDLVPEDAEIVAPDFGSGLPDPNATSPPTAGDPPVRSRRPCSAPAPS